MKEIEPQSEPTLSSALEHVLGSTQKAVVARMELLQIEAQEDFSRAMQGAGIVVAGATLLFSGWNVLMGLVLYWLKDVLGLGTGLVAMVLLNFALGAAVVSYGIRYLARIRLMTPDEPAPVEHAAAPAGGKVERA